MSQTLVESAVDALTESRQVKTLTPTRPSATKESTNTPTNGTPGSYAPSSYRLLYRGAISLPDSLLCLDGLTFAARLHSPTKQSTFHLLQNPLALALESMRGRPTLRFMGTVALKDIYMDESGGVEMDIHPSAILSQIYFENLFCLQPFSTVASTSSSAQRSEIGVRLALGDSNGPETTRIVVYAQISSENTKNIRLCVGRITPRPPPAAPQQRVPRPDDPIPRKPPAFFIRDGRELKRVASTGMGPVKKQKLNSGGVAADLGSGVRLSADVFKVPELPKKSMKAKGKEKERDVFGEISEVTNERVRTVEEEAALEKTNKNAVKRATIDYLAKTKDPTARFIDKQHPEFKDLYGFIYRGVVFALRAKMKTCTVESGLISRLIDKHALMYLGGNGGSADRKGT
ncbi:hypothetical protein D9613_001008 [Agrocybe pediades]|uniref:Sld7 C-terminal domain-containing protein n=1 Tax=Agrocybe pediades TaxID=84607 RepID=A0A8H4VV13_9AGAR|nr:hypothetical protein D9613_001008 [Agrocybe pediades]